MREKISSVLNILIPTLILWALMIIALLRYPVIFDNSKSIVFTTFVSSIAYIFIWKAMKPDIYAKNAGLLIGLLFVINISIEEFIDWPTETSTLVSTLGMMFVIFVSFAVISAIKVLQTGNLFIGIKSSFQSALLGTIIALLFGFSIDYVFSERRVSILQNYPGFKEYGNAKAFTFFNSFDNASNHILIAPVIAIIMGTLGGMTSLLILKLKKRNNK